MPAGMAAIVACHTDPRVANARHAERAAACLAGCIQVNTLALLATAAWAGTSAAARSEAAFPAPAGNIQGVSHALELVVARKNAARMAARSHVLRFVAAQAAWLGAQGWERTAGSRSARRLEAGVLNAAVAEAAMMEAAAL